MKLKYATALFIFLVLFVSCSRDEPSPVSVTPPPAIISVKMNEVYSRGVPSNPDWIEIYNPNSDSINLSGYKIYNLGGKNGTKPKKSFPAGAMIPANGLFVIVVNDTTTTSGFDLSTTGETVWFENGSGTVIDSLAIPALGTDTSYARKPDGANTWVTATPPTKGVANAFLPIVMNELFSRGVPGNLDWIEMYNSNAISVDISGYKIYDAGGQGGTKPKKGFPAGTIIPAKGYFVITVDSTDASGFGLSSTGEPVWLENASGNVIDNVALPAVPATTQSYGRYPDGGSTWQILNTITRDAANKP